MSNVSLMSKTCQSMVQCVKRLTLEDREKDRKREQEKDAADRLAEKEEVKNLKGTPAAGWDTVDGSEIVPSS